MKPLVLASLLVTGVACAAPAAATPLPLDVRSPDIQANQPIPVAHTCDGDDAAPAVTWSAPPAGAKSVALLLDDPDAPRGVFTHWLVTGLPATTTTLPAGGELPAGAVAAKNDFGKPGYNGPCPPHGAPHHYHVRVFALDVAPPAPASRAAFMAAIAGHVLAQGELVATYQRR